MKRALSQLDVAVAAGAGGRDVAVARATGVKVGVFAEGAEVAVSAGGKVGVLFAESCACTVKAAAVKTASGLCWFDVVDGRLQASMAPMITATARVI